MLRDCDGAGFIWHFSIIIFLVGSVILSVRIAAQDNMLSFHEIEVEMQDSVSKAESIKIAKQFIIDQGLRTSVIFLFPRVKELSTRKEYWEVLFYPSLKYFFPIPFPFSVEVNKKTGEVGIYGWAK
jgi:hypothetical protein